MPTGIVLSKGENRGGGGLVALLALGLWWNSLLGKMAESAQAQLWRR
jgi:hypothetical protein